MPTDNEVFWRAWLKPETSEIDARQRNTTTLGRCPTCEGLVRFSSPETVRSDYAINPYGHDADCRALVIAAAGAGGSGGGSGAVTLGRADILLSNASVTLGTLTD